jgi:hypothetical protein
LGTSRTLTILGIQLRRKDDKTDIAIFHNKSLGLIGEAHSAYLEIFSGGDSSEMMDGILLGFIYMEKLKRDTQRDANAAAANSAAAASVAAATS